MECIPIIKYVFNFNLKRHFEMEDFQKVSEKEVKIMVKEVKILERYLKNNCGKFLVFM
jgi:hypothetical protein